MLADIADYGIEERPGYLSGYCTCGKTLRIKGDKVEIGKLNSITCPDCGYTIQVYFGGRRKAEIEAESDAGYIR